MKFRKTMLAAVSVFALAMPLSASAQGVSPETAEQIQAMLAEMQCEMDPSDIEVEDDGYELDDVFCADGQYDIELDSNLNETGRRKE
ncbi:PepSY domain-containing protein [Amaricoccus macauensis]|uniref:PepSY domain-containing protein n=1 Tax=Amaricoccus macauensis TaxID=57001 RepID=UPI003C7ECAF4